MQFETILYEEQGRVGILTLNRPEDGNMFTETMCHEIRDYVKSQTVVYRDTVREMKMPIE
jgi:naphthoate synthase